MVGVCEVRWCGEREGGRGLRRDRGKSAGVRGREGVRFRGRGAGLDLVGVVDDRRRSGQFLPRHIEVGGLHGLYACD